MSTDEKRRELEKRAKDPLDWQARLELAELRVRLGELTVLARTRAWLVVRSARHDDGENDAVRGGAVVAFPCDPSADSLASLVEAMRQSGTRPNGGACFGPNDSVRPRAPWTPSAWEGARGLPVKFVPLRSLALPGWLNTYEHEIDREGASVRTLAEGGSA